MLLTTTATEDEARALAKGLLTAGLAACVQLSQIDSLYIWDDAVAEDPEVRLMIKTRRTLAQAASAWIEREHPYEVPQVVILPALAVGSGYLEWAIEVTPAAP
ncbi:MAG: divalent-cation tolerance protein CutA [Gammaproteobacteria bacterium]|nr:divalent-cation tolerance protein CutA [Gammaproteobacteria bacterium]